MAAELKAQVMAEVGGALEHAERDGCSDPHPARDRLMQAMTDDARALEAAAHLIRKCCAASQSRRVALSPYVLPPADA